MTWKGKNDSLQRRIQSRVSFISRGVHGLLKEGETVLGRNSLVLLSVAVYYAILVALFLKKALS